MDLNRLIFSMVKVLTGLRYAFIKLIWTKGRGAPHQLSHRYALFCQRSVSCNQVISMSTRSRFWILNHDQSDHHGHSMAFIIVMKGAQSSHQGSKSPAWWHFFIVHVQMDEASVEAPVLGGFAEHNMGRKKTNCCTGGYLNYWVNLY